MNDPKKLFGIPMEHQIERTEYLASDDSIYVWQVTTIWVDVGDVVWEKHQYEAWRMRVGEDYSEALSGFDIPREVLDAHDPHAVPPDGALVDPSDGPEPSSEDSFWEEGPCVYYADEPEEIPPEEGNDVDDA